MKVLDAFNRVMSGRRKHRDDRPFPPAPIDLLQDEHPYFNHFPGNVVFTPITEKCFDPFQMSPNDLSQHYYQTRHTGNPYIVHSGTNINHEHSFTSTYDEQQFHQQQHLMAFALPSSSQSTSDYSSNKSNISRRRHGSFSNSASPKPVPQYTSDGRVAGSVLNAFHQRSRSSSGGYRQAKLTSTGLKTSHDAFYNLSLIHI